MLHYVAHVSHFFGAKSKRTPGKLRLVQNLNYQKFEDRKLLAGISFDSGTGVVSVVGGPTDDVSILSNFSPTQVQVSLTGFASQTFATSSLSKVVFIGLGGDDYFRNDTSLVSAASGGFGNDRLFGGSGKDDLRGDGGDDFVDGLDGDDFIDGGDGDDFERGGNGDDILRGGLGNDILRGGDGLDRLEGNNGNDRLFGEFDDDVIIGGVGDEYQSGGSGNDVMYGNEGIDIILGDSGNDQIFGNAGNDRLFGGVGDDEIHGSFGLDLIVGDAGDDQLFGDDHSDTIFGNAGDDQIFGGAANDFLYGGDGNDVVYGDGERDVVYGNAGDDELHGGNAEDQLYGNDGNDRLLGELGSDILYGQLGNDALIGGVDAVDKMFGGDGKDRFLFFGADIISDLETQDARLEFRHGSANWSNAELVVIDDGLALMQARTNNTQLLKGTVTQQPVVFIKEFALASDRLGSNELVTVNELVFNPRTGRVDTITKVEHQIRFGEWDETDLALNELHLREVPREMAHNWASSAAIAAVLPNQASFFASFANLSGWTQTRPAENVITFFDVSLDNKWWFLRTGLFTETFATTNLVEDFSATWKFFFDPFIPSNSKVPFLAKLSLLDDLFTRLEGF